MAKTGLVVNIINEAYIYNVIYDVRYLQKLNKIQGILFLGTD